MDREEFRRIQTRRSFFRECAGGIGIVALASAKGYRVHWLYLAFVAQVLTMAGSMIVSLLTAPPPAECWQ